LRAAGALAEIINQRYNIFTAVYTLKASKLEEKHGRILKRIGGMLMFTLASVVLINPALINSISSSLLILVLPLWRLCSCCLFAVRSCQN
jgi:hypothetical protein